MAKLFGALPEGVLDSIFGFASDGPLRLVFDAKRKKFVSKANNNFMSLKKALQFKIYNPPHRMIDGWELEEEDEEIDITDIDDDLTEVLTFKYPLKLRLHEGCFDDFHIDDGYLSVAFYYSKDWYTKVTKKCSISIPEYYISLRSKAYNHYKEQMDKRLSNKQIYRVRNLVKGFSSGSYDEY